MYWMAGSWLCHSIHWLFENPVHLSAQMKLIVPRHVLRCRCKCFMAKKKFEGCHFRSEASLQFYINCWKSVFDKMQASRCTMIKEPFDIAFPLSEEESPVQSSSDCLQALRKFVNMYFCLKILCTLHSLHISSWHGRSWSFLSLQSQYFCQKQPFCCMYT